MDKERRVFVSTCAIQLKMPANQATLGRLEAVLARLEVVAAKLGVEGSFKKGSSHSAADIKALVERLETAADKLEQQSALGGEGSGKIVEFYDEFLKGKIQTFFKLSDELGGDVKTQVDLVKKAFQALRVFLVKASNTKLPTKNEHASMIKPISQLREEVEAFRDRNRGSKQFNHLSAVSEGIEAVLWVGAPGKPDIFVRDRKDGAVFYTNRVLKDFKSDPRHGEWAHTFIGGLIELQQYCKEFHPMGVSWAS
ncbi:hypothetical protein ACROYT_G034969 [Oculina patagonica]